MNVDQQSYAEHSIIDYSHNVTKTCDQEITNTHEVFKQTESKMIEISSESGTTQPVTITLIDE